MKRAPSKPPALPGYRPISHLGSGGFADVFLYEQELPHRQVAVKVLIESVVDANTRQRFVAEANAMARLSAHPAIVTIYFAGVSPDGRPCLVMEYCSRTNMGQRFRRERIEVAEALRVGIRLASAVESAHRAGILHRDIKPANVLVTDYGWPALTDFGISAQLDTSSAEAEGMSIPWSAPELFGRDSRTDVRTDVYSLGATVYALLAGRSPFEVRGGANSAASLMARIERQPVPPTGRDDVPPLLQQTLARAMHKRSEARYRSAYDFARALQVVEGHLDLPGTQIEVMEGVLDEGEGDDHEATHLRPVVTINDEPGVQLAEDTWSQSDVAPAALGPLPDTDPVRTSRGVVRALVAGLGLLLLIAVIAGVIIFGPQGAGPMTEPPVSPTRVIRQSEVAAPVAEECTLADGQLTCSWHQPDLVDGTRWKWHWAEGTPGSTIDEPRLTVTVPEGRAPCIVVVAVHPSGGTSRSPLTMCAD
ncbi:serine/threonine-protein kinase [Microlunatus sp. Y2014]|uniref:serine/threonine-protein kinase n=1 Tax=Microlunatus sp. Y2014 TaxID=3418488 RepID=UPI003DA70BA8